MALPCVCTDRLSVAKLAVLSVFCFQLRLMKFEFAVVLLANAKQLNMLLSVCVILPRFADSLSATSYFLSYWQVYGADCSVWLCRFYL